MSQTIKLKRSAIAGKVPTTGNLDLGEIALNTNDGKVFFKKDDGTPSIQTIVTTDSQITGSIELTGSITASSAKFANLNYPTSDGAANTVIGTDGNGNLSFISPSATSVFPYEGDAVITGSLIVSASGATNDFQVGDNKLFVSASGNVGIGNTSPASKLEVTGNVAIGYTNAAPTNGMIVSGDVGIGTTSPAAKLHVTGDAIRVVSSTFAGIEAHNSNGTWESFIGTESGGGGNRYNAASSQHTFYNNSTAVMKIKSSGNVGIGTTSPDEKLDVNGSIKARETGAGNGFLLHTNSGISANANLMQFWSSQPSGLSFHTNGTGDGSNERMRIDSDGNVGIGTTAPRNALDVRGSNAKITVRTDTDNSGAIGIDFSAEDGSTDITKAAIIADATGAWTRQDMHFVLDSAADNNDYTLGTDTKMIIKNAGNVGIGTTSPSTKLEVNGTATVTSLVETSTRELKENIESLVDQSTIVDSLQPVSYTWRDSKEEDFGLIAEDVEEIAPHLVHRNEDGKPTGIKYSKLSVLLLDVVQRQNILINDLNERITKLENDRGN